jgi:hypothetical protein
VFATRRVEYLPNLMTVWELRRAGLAGCDCPLLRTYRQALQEPFSLDVDGGRIAIARSDSVEVLSGDGSSLMSVSGIPAEPQLFRSAVETVLSGDELFVRAGSALRDYDVAVPTLRRTWPLPAVPPSPTSQMLQDVGHGLVAYVRGADIHVLRLVDGADRIVAHGMLARFIDTGLVYAEGSRLHLISWARLQ